MPTIIVRVYGLDVGYPWRMLGLYTECLLNEKMTSNTPCSIFIVYYLTSLQLQISNHLIVHTMSTFGKHHLTATNGIVASIIGAVIKMPMSKVGNTWGRVELFVAVVLVTVFGRD